MRPASFGAADTLRCRIGNELQRRASVLPHALTIEVR